MPSLAQLLDAHGSLLVLDAASARVQVGWLSTHEAAWSSSHDEAGKALFSGLDSLLKNAPANRSIAAAGAFVFCEGPGSILGIRTAATAIRTWRTLSDSPTGVISQLGQTTRANRRRAQHTLSGEPTSVPVPKKRACGPVYSYQSLALLAHGLGDPELTLIADARRDHWHVQRLGQPLRQVPSSELADTKGPLAMPEGFRHWTTPPPNLARVPYDLETLFATERVRAADRAFALVADLFTPTSEPDAFLHNEATYKTWSPQIHRAPST